MPEPVVVAASSRPGAAVDLVPVGLGGVGAGGDGDHLALVVDDPEEVFVDLDGDGLAGVGLADVDALVDDLDRTLARHSPTDAHGRRAGRRERSGLAGALEPGPLPGRESEGERPPQLAVSDHVGGVLIEADRDPLAGQRHPD